MRNWDNLVNKYINEMESRGLSEAYRKNYRRELHKWKLWLIERTSIKKIESICVFVHNFT